MLRKREGRHCRMAAFTLSIRKHFTDNLFGHAEGERHSCAAESGHDGHTTCRASDKDGLFRVLGIDAVPALRNLQLRGFEERCKIVEDKRIYTRLVERRDIESVFVR